MGAYLAKIDAAPESERWRLVRSWIFAEPLPFFEELRRERPILALPELTLATRFADCSLILRRHQTFSVELYKPKQGGFFMAQDDTAVHWREKSIMKAILDREDIPKIREWVGQKTAEALRDGKGDVDAVPAITRAIPIRLVQEWFGFTRSKPRDLQEWSYWNQQDAFWNQPFDKVAVADPAAVERKREAANVMLAIYLARLMARRKFALLFGSSKQDPVTRILRLTSSGATRLALKDAVFNIGGLLIGAVETTSHACVNALQAILERPERQNAAATAAASDNVQDFDGFVFEALRFRPAFPYFFRVCKRETALGLGTQYETIVKPGATVLALTHSAMFDDAVFKNAAAFDPRRDLTETFTFGQGLHQCLGVAIAGVMVPEIVRQVLRQKNLRAEGSPDFKGTNVPESWRLRYNYVAS